VYVSQIHSCYVRWVRIVIGTAVQWVDVHLTPDIQLALSKSVAFSAFRQTVLQAARFAALARGRSNAKGEAARLGCQRV
jgi:hypothetical protein